MGVISHQLPVPFPIRATLIPSGMGWCTDLKILFSVNCEIAWALLSSSVGSDSCLLLKSRSKNHSHWAFTDISSQPLALHICLASSWGSLDMSSHTTLLRVATYSGWMDIWKSSSILVMSRMNILAIGLPGLRDISQVTTLVLSPT